KAQLTNASLCQANLTSAELEDAAFLGAYLKGAKLDMARNIPRIIYLNAENVLYYGLPVPPEK
ncbi:MAG: pentapeptide repeat-containing protein, partial [Gallionella sp.]|nr:pentapeptide repeat-containing protein [Gallionella sp.]